MQRMISIEGDLLACHVCGKQPRHWHELGGNLHFLECSPCGSRTPKLPTFTQAIQAWETSTVTPLQRFG